MCQTTCFEDASQMVKSAFKDVSIKHQTCFTLLSMQRIPNGLAVPDYEAGGVKTHCNIRVCEEKHLSKLHHYTKTTPI
jgi:hypothetical protein